MRVQLASLPAPPPHPDQGHHHTVAAIAPSSSFQREHSLFRSALPLCRSGIDHFSCCLSSVIADTIKSPYYFVQIISSDLLISSPSPHAHRQHPPPPSSQRSLSHARPFLSALSRAKPLLPLFAFSWVALCPCQSTISASYSFRLSSKLFFSLMFLLASSGCCCSLLHSNHPPEEKHRLL